MGRSSWKNSSIHTSDCVSRVTCSDLHWLGLGLGESCSHLVKQGKRGKYYQRYGSGDLYLQVISRNSSWPAMAQTAQSMASSGDAGSRPLSETAATESEPTPAIPNFSKPSQLHSTSSTSGLIMPATYEEDLTGLIKKVMHHDGASMHEEVVEIMFGSGKSQPQQRKGSKEKRPTEEPVHPEGEQAPTKVKKTVEKSSVSSGSRELSKVGGNLRDSEGF